MRVLVLLLLMGLQRHAEGSTNCGQDKRLKIMKNESAYQLELCNCTDNCATAVQLYFNITLCNDEQELCGSFGGRSTHDCGNPSACMSRKNTVESFFNKCATSSPLILQPITSTVCTNDNEVVAVGSLTGLLLMILVLVVTGWVWTCWTLKKRKEEIQHYKNCQEQESDSEEERVYPNQMYKMTTAQPVVGTDIQQPLYSLEESGQSINGLSSKDNKGYCGVNRVENIYTSSEGSSHSSLQEEQRVNRVEEGESGKKHVYHILEKPGGDDYENQTKI